MENNSSIMSIPNDGQNELVLNESNMEMVLAEAEKKVALMSRVLTVSIKATNSKDWTDQNGHPFPTASAAEKIGGVFGIKMELPVPPEGLREEREDNKGKYYIYTFTAKFILGARYIYAIGSGSSRDKFFSWDSGTKSWKELSEFDETNIKKAAYSNLVLNGITRILGIRNLTWEQLEAGGIKKDEVSKIDYNKGKETGGEKKSEYISEPQRKRLIAIASKSNYTPETLKEWLMFNFNIASTTEIPWKQYDVICKKVEAEPAKKEA